MLLPDFRFNSFGMFGSIFLIVTSFTCVLVADWLLERRLVSAEGALSIYLQAITENNYYKYM